jgi:NADP-dependent 3-hydroxy acid dehydrogenase YdfG
VFREAAKAVEKTISERWPETKVWAVKCDVGKEQMIKEAVEEGVKKFGRLDVMVSPGQTLKRQGIVWSSLIWEPELMLCPSSGD